MNAEPFGPTRTFSSWKHPDEWRWFALKIAPGKEFAAERILRDDGHDVFLPIKHIGKKGQLYARPRLPGYVFIGANGGVIEWPKVLRFRMIIDFVAFDDGKPMPLPAKDMYWLIRRNESITPIKRKTLSRRQRETLSKPMPIVTGPYQGHVVSTMTIDRDIVLCRFLDQHLAKSIKSA